MLLMYIITKRNQLSSQLTGYGWVTAAGFGRGQTGDSPLWQSGEPEPPTSVLKSLKGGSRFGRLDLFSQIGVSSVALALQDAGRLNNATGPQSLAGLECGLICATTSSCEKTDHDFHKTIQTDPRLASPGLFVYTLATSFLGEAALRFAITGNSMALIEPRPSGAEALRLALEQLAYGDEEIMIVGISNFFDRQRCEAPFFSGALFLILKKEHKGLSPLHTTIRYDPEESIFYCHNQICSDILSIPQIISKQTTK